MKVGIALCAVLAFACGAADEDYDRSVDLLAREIEAVPANHALHAAAAMSLARRRPAEQLAARENKSDVIAGINLVGRRL